MKQAELKLHRKLHEQVMRLAGVQMEQRVEELLDRLGAEQE